MNKKVEGRKVKNIIYIIAIFAIVLSCFFSSKLSILLYLQPNYTFNNNTEIHFINVGQGDAIAIKFDSGKVMLVDTGTIEYQDKLKNYLNNIVLNDKKTIDYLVLTHIDKDHSGNMMFILDNYEIGTFYRPKIYSSQEDLSSINTSKWYDAIISECYLKNIQMIFNESGVMLNEGFTNLTWLSPIGISHNDIIESNDFSPAIKIEYNGCSALLTGDISSDEESKLLNNYSAEFLDIDILKLAHHGSRYSTSSGFLSITTPKYACISVGDNNYGHPSNYVLERILEHDKLFNSNLYSNIYTTLDQGNIIFTLDDQINVDCIENIDNYSFVPYFVYAIILIFILAYFMLLPYVNVWKKNIRFVIQNKKFKELQENSNNKDTP